MKGEGDRLPGPGSVRVGRFVGRLGVVCLPAVEVGLGLDARVVRRHVARLQEAGWLRRAAGVWGEGSIVWLTEQGLAAVGLGGLQAVRASPAPSPTLTAHGVQVAWSAARVQRRGLVWRSARELALERERWEVRAWDERGLRMLLPDLAVWPAGSATPAAVVIDAGQRRASRQQAILEAWRDALLSGRYVALRYDCAGEQAARRITGLAEKVGLRRSAFLAVAQMTSEQIAAIEPKPAQSGERLPAASPAPANGRQAEQPSSEPEETPSPTDPTASYTSRGPLREAPSAPAPEAQMTPEQAVAREELVREVLGYPEPKRRRRWRR